MADAPDLSPDSPTPDGWTLDDVMEKAPLPHVAITKKNMRKGETEVVSCRVSREDYAKIQKIVQQRRISGIETYSDLMTDALFLWFEKYYEEFPTIDPGAAQEMRMVRLIAISQQREEYLELSTKTLERIIHDKDKRAMDVFHTDIMEAKYTYENQDAPADYLEKLSNMIDHVRRLLDAS